MRRLTRFAVPVLAVACALGVSACGGNDSGGSDTSATETSATTETSGSTETAASADVAAGKNVFTANCGSCHALADAGTSGAVGPDLDDLQPDAETVANQVRDGGGAMPSFSDTLSADDITNVAAYVSSVAGS